MSVLKAEDLVKIYGGKSNSTHALYGMNITVKKGEFVAVMGPSGSGKTTLLNILGGLDNPTSGEVKIKEELISKMDENQLAKFRRENIGFIFQDFNLLDSLTIKENIMLPLILDAKLDAKIMEKKSENIMSYLAIENTANKYPYNVSGGEQQRAVAARAIINDPAVILADEPTGNLDSKSSKIIMSYLRQLNIKKSSTILTVTHDPLAASYTDRIVFIKDGSVYMELIKKEKKEQFFDRIMNCLAILEGDRSDI
jgi:putative ABC transport system ATP-binding protein